MPSLSFVPSLTWLRVTALTGALGCVLLSSACTSDPYFLLRFRQDDAAIAADKARMDDDLQAGNFFRYAMDQRRLSDDVERQELDRYGEEEDEDFDPSEASARGARGE
jgi:hypothetical protein